MSSIATFRVPDRDREMLIALLDMEASEAKQLCVEIDESDGKFASVASLLDKRGLDGRAAWRALMSLMVTGRHYRIDTESIVDGLKESFTSEDSANTEGITALLTNETIMRFAKAVTLRNEYERIVTDSRVITDFRPVFDDDPDNPTVQAAIINHSLRINYTGGDGKGHEVHLSLDSADLKKLSTQIEKALKKDEAVETLVERTGTTVLRPLESSE